MDIVNTKILMIKEDIIDLVSKIFCVEIPLKNTKIFFINLFFLWLKDIYNLRNISFEANNAQFWNGSGL